MLFSCPLTFFTSAVFDHRWANKPVAVQFIWREVKSEPNASSLGMPVPLCVRFVQEIDWSVYFRQFTSSHLLWDHSDGGVLSSAHKNTEICKWMEQIWNCIQLLRVSCFCLSWSQTPFWEGISLAPCGSRKLNCTYSGAGVWQPSRLWWCTVPSVIVSAAFNLVQTCSLMIFDLSCLL